MFKQNILSFFPNLVKMKNLPELNWCTTCWHLFASLALVNWSLNLDFYWIMFVLQEPYPLETLTDIFGLSKVAKHLVDHRDLTSPRMILSECNSAFWLMSGKILSVALAWFR